MVFAEADGATYLDLFEVVVNIDAQVLGVIYQKTAPVDQAGEM